MQGSQGPENCPNGRQWEDDMFPWLAFLSVIYLVGTPILLASSPQARIATYPFLNSLLCPLPEHCLKSQYKNSESWKDEP